MAGHHVRCADTRLLGAAMRTRDLLLHLGKVVTNNLPQISTSAGLSASVTGWRAKRDDSSCDLLFDDEDHAATWYVYKASNPARVHRVAEYSSSTLG